MTRGHKRAIFVGLVAVLAVGLLVLTRGLDSESSAPKMATASGGPQGTVAAASYNPVLATQSTVQGEVSGRVLDQLTGASVAGARVTLSGDDEVARSADTDANGAFTIALPAARRFVVTDVSAKGYLPFSPEWGSSPIAVVARSGARIQDLTLVLRPFVEYTGVVENSKGARVANASVKLVDLRVNESADRLTDEFVSDAKGEFKFYAPEPALLEARHAAHGTGRARVDRAVAFSRRLVIRLDQPADANSAVASIVGVVVDSNGLPIPGSVVRAVHVESHGLHPRAEVRSGSDGRFEITGLDPGMHVVWVVCDGCSSTRTRVMTGKEVTLTVGLGGSIVGRVLDGKDGSPVQTFAVQVLRVRGDHEIVLDELTVVDPEGRFSFGGLSAGDYAVRAAAQGRASPDSVPATVTDSDLAPTEVIVRLPIGTSIEGVVTDRASNSPIANARVSIEGNFEFGSSALPLGITTVTDGAGRFELTGVAPGARSVRAGASGYHMAMVTGLQAEDGGRVGPVQLKLSRAGENEPARLELTGIGARLASDKDALMIEELVEGGGAKLAGLAVGEGIIKIDGELVRTMGPRAALERTRGPAGTHVLLSVRAPNSEVRDVDVERRAFRY